MSSCFGSVEHVPFRMYSLNDDYITTNITRWHVTLPTVLDVYSKAEMIALILHYLEMCASVCLLMHALL